MDKDIAAALREQFAPEKIGKLPRVTCGNCSDKRKQCNDHVKSRCKICNAWVSEKHIHLDFVGHADTTDRFLQVDPEWTWEPVHRDVDPNVLAAAASSGNPDVLAAVLSAAPPKFDSKGGMWIRLTIGGVTRLGYGDAAGKDGPNAVKEAIGDALRNAGMRFGVGLDMWRKEGAEAPESAQVPDEQRTDKRWLTGMKRRIHEAEYADELKTLASEIEAKVHTGRCEQSHYEQLWELGKRRQAELFTANPPAADTPRPAAAPESSDSPTSDDLAALAQESEARIQAATTREQLAEIRAVVMADFEAKKHDPKTGSRLLRMITTRLTALDARAAADAETSG